MDPNLPSNKQVELYEMLLSLLEHESKCIEGVRESEEEVREILNDRTQEEASHELDISVYDTERNEKAKKHRRELVSLIFWRRCCSWLVLEIIVTDNFVKIV